ncbi:MAG: DUF1566 domain-containing protein [Thermodesulfobacteriota bacterium]|nr:DUF1566 domain-containing protein [Thermodesulfobacteriota bacterium]
MSITRFQSQPSLILQKRLPISLIWVCDANLANNCPFPIDPKLFADCLFSFYSAKWFYRSIMLGNRTGWRLSTVEKLSRLIDPSQSAPALPTGHSFVNIPATKEWWSSTTFDDNSNYAFFVQTSDDVVHCAIETIGFTSGRYAVALGIQTQVNDNRQAHI